MARKKKELTNDLLPDAPLTGEEYESWRKPLDVFSLEDLQEITVNAARRIEALERKNDELWSAYQATQQARLNAPKARLAKSAIAQAKFSIQGAWLFRSVLLEGKGVKQAQFAREMGKKYPCITNPERTILSWTTQWKKTPPSTESFTREHLPEEAKWFEAEMATRPRIYGLLRCDPLEKWVQCKLLEGTAWGEIAQIFKETAPRKEAGTPEKYGHLDDCPVP